MAGGTHVFDMIKRLKQNQELKKLKYFKKQQSSAHASNDRIVIDKNSWTKNDLDELRNNRKRQRWLKAYRILRLTVFLSIIVYLIYYFLGSGRS
jgi:hypothetical protein